MFLLMMLSILLATEASPLVGRCFQGGMVIKELVADHSLPHVCIKDDISMIKVDSTAEQKGNEKTIFTSTVTRKFLQDNWKDCRPEKMLGGPIMILAIDENGHLNSEEYVCQNDCIIKVDKELGLIIFETTSLNFFEVSGTTITSGWFKTTTSVSLRHTCEHVKVQCGLKSYVLHACFKNHIECYQSLHGKYIPKYMASSICANLELIILCTFVLMIFTIFVIASRTFVSYILLPVFMPVSYIYCKLISKCCAECKSCSLPTHPFTKCPLICVCGSVYESTERLKLHRISGLCSGFKHILTARHMCKSKGCGLILSVIISFLAVMFITPVGADDCIPLEKIPEEFRLSIDYKQNLENMIQIYIAVAACALIISVIVYIIIIKYPYILLSRLVYSCQECKMYHAKKGIKHGEFGTNKCGTCLCGCTEDNPMVIVHQQSRICFSDSHLYIYKIICTFFLLIIFIQTTAVASAQQCSPDISKTDCWGLNIELKMKELKGSGNTSIDAINQLFPDITPQEIEHLNLSLSSYHQLIVESEKHESFRVMQILEAFWFDKKPYMESGFKISDEYILWKSRSRLMELNSCVHSAAIYPCQCIQSETNCMPVLSMRTASSYGIYLTNQDQLVQDANNMITVLSSIIQPTTMAKIRYVFTKKSNELDNLTTNIVKMYKRHYYLANNLYLLLRILKKSLEKKSEVIFPDHVSLPKESDYQELARPPTLTSPKVYKMAKNVCKKAKCITHKIGEHRFLYLLCNNQIFHWSDHYVNNSQNICYADANCDIAFPSLTKEQLNIINIKAYKCSKQNLPNLFSQYSKPRRSCRMVEKGSCYLADNYKQMIKCANGQIYEQQATGYYGSSGTVDQVCFKLKCEVSYPRDPALLHNCTIAVPRQHISRSITTQVEDIESFRQNLEDSFFSVLQVFEYKKTSGLPAIKPTFKPLSITGTPTENGIEGASFVVDINALAGTAIGLNLNTPDGTHVMDLVVYIKSANISSTYSLLYRTGPTITYNSVHSEHCTGRCPEHVSLRDETWAQFTKESTSTWGCEEYGCLAIGTGCLYGQCKDVIKPELDVYKKMGEEKMSVEICITHSHDSYCKVVTSLEPSITTKFNIQFKTVESFNMPNLVAVSDHRVLVGQMNNLGEFSGYCGDVQFYNGTTIGKGHPKVDYRCHPFSRKDIIIRQCYNNHYDSCRHLIYEPNFMIDSLNDNNIEIGIHRKNLGIVTAQIQLGDLNYKLFTENPVVDINGKCLGCPDCIEGIQCELIIKTSIGALCSVKSNCDPMISRLKIEAGHHTYSDKFVCPQKTKILELQICGGSKKIDIVEMKRKPMLEIGTVQHAPVLVQHDNKCGTWICRTGEELSKLLTFNVSGFFSQVWHYLVLIVIIIIVLLFARYIVIPLIIWIINELRRHEREQKNLQKRR
ncbi:polyprotein [Las Maloyas virus]|uniref:Envelopment polyprotein n=1 Tax=Las Maloyas virus TaxID=2748212 RepID=A0A7D9MVX0_9VIRU|nr:polyprotein [Las Maloyas virus]QLA47056.1 polyprotein [Las Maloyas virus]